MDIIISSALESAVLGCKLHLITLKGELKVRKHKVLIMLLRAKGTGSLDSLKESIFADFILVLGSLNVYPSFSDCPSLQLQPDPLFQIQITTKGCFLDIARSIALYLRLDQWRPKRRIID